MNEERIQAYGNLIQQLLSCPNGERPQILDDNSELLDLGFVQVCEAKAAGLAEEGKQNDAAFYRTCDRILHPSPHRSHLRCFSRRLGKDAK
ncbi:hypothetical protein ACE1CI_06005 [Aerosakkonemataceae cyanobacterium BLCC-F50]|uniref:Uncharacterized protein n=1 Tax=Floridaenema flaviceps BLCC-F50 TaxID=3153642 RepID=A0ABV4XLA8_9CYAN